ncbi:AP2 domain-containing protein [Brevibacterium linens]|uniref:Pathogenesis-related transcriptional factor and ERF protein n=1 Tax=Brevibacterium linens TaxID=1703 RepID=A0A0B9AP09_BRELN|nr:HNH endonuclease [Brevibacterium linens]KHS52557.1 Pathogenesis-related transcriptional factor and ERF protein [Brevibacterium linens]
MTKRTCSVDGCDRPFIARGYCARHYRMARRDGMPTVQSKTSVAERFWAKVDKSGDCWIWTAGKDKNGYGGFNFDGRPMLAHRAAWELTHCQQLSPKTELDHACRNPSCVNPDHLRPADRSRNMQNQSAEGHQGRNGARGVYWHKVNKKWVAQVRHNKKTYYLGQFATIEEAATVAKAKRLELHTYNDTDRAA